MKGYKLVGRFFLKPVLQNLSLIISASDENHSFRNRFLYTGSQINPIYQL